MSHQLLEQVWTQCPISGSPLVVLLGIAEMSSARGDCYATYADLAGRARMSRATVVRGLRDLRRERWIVRHHVKGRGGALLLQINLPKLSRSRRENLPAAPPLVSDSIAESAHPGLISPSPGPGGRSTQAEPAMSDATGPAAGRRGVIRKGVRASGSGQEPSRNPRAIPAARPSTKRTRSEAPVHAQAT